MLRRLFFNSTKVYNGVLQVFCFVFVSWNLTKEVVSGIRQCSRSSVV